MDVRKEDGQSCHEAGSDVMWGKVGPRDGHYDPGASPVFEADGSSSDSSARTAGGQSYHEAGSGAKRETGRGRRRKRRRRRRRRSAMEEEDEEGECDGGGGFRWRENTAGPALTTLPRAGRCPARRYSDGRTAGRISVVGVLGSSLGWLSGCLGGW